MREQRKRRLACWFEDTRTHIGRARWGVEPAAGLPKAVVEMIVFEGYPPRARICESRYHPDSHGAKDPLVTAILIEADDAETWESVGDQLIERAREYGTLAWVRDFGEESYKEAWVRGDNVFTGAPLVYWRERITPHQRAPEHKQPAPTEVPATPGPLKAAQTETKLRVSIMSVGALGTAASVVALAGIAGERGLLATITLFIFFSLYLAATPQPDISDLLHRVAKAREDDDARR